MLRANNEALFQGTNQSVISIRQAELQYYTMVYQSFATQAALIGGFTYGVLQNTTRGAEWTIDLDLFYGLFAILTIILAIHIILCCLFLSVYGPGLSLYGQTGSMARATEVLRKEQPMIIRSFILMISFFICSTITLIWTVMDYLGAIISSALMAVAVQFWWSYNHRIYAQLAWNPTNEGADTRASEEEDPITRMMKSPLHGAVQQTIQMTHKGNPVTASSSSSLTKTGSCSASPSVVMEGFLARKILTSSSSTGAKWDRKYFLLSSWGKLAVFKDRREYRETGTSSLKERALDLEDFQIIFDFPLSSAAASAWPSEVKELLLQSEKKCFFYLVSREELEDNEDVKRKTQKILYTCDTEEELLTWKQTMLLFSKVEPK